jgi:hypothetical protein
MHLMRSFVSAVTATTAFGLLEWGHRQQHLDVFHQSSYRFV